MTEQSRGTPDRQDEQSAAPGDPSGDNRPGDDAAGYDPGNDTGQVLGQSVPVRREVAEAPPGSPQTGAVRTADGRPSAEKPYP
ncbi:hypothetical protein [Plantactinospora sp. CA-290183]|uniref:hypothetical protein n=1 Tax=Plantactinospora sp. CA-290183 TaxID=3240006 RepID=UPI003D89C494